MIKRVKFKLAKDFPFYIQGEVITVLPVGTEFVMDMPAELMRKMAGLGYIQVVEESEFDINPDRALLKAEGKWPAQ